MRRSLTALFATALLVFSTACFEIEQSIDLQKDMSGTADLKIGIDMEPMILIMAQVGREMEGKKGPVPQADIDKAKAEFRKSAQKEKKTDPKAERQEIEKELPDGIKLIGFDIEEKDFAMISKMKFSFRNLNDLVAVKLPSKDEGGDPTKKNIIDSPFEGLQVIEKGNRLTIQTRPMNPQEDVKKETSQTPAATDPETEKMMKDAFKNLRIAYRINAPFEIVSHNAERKEGNALIWEFTLDDMEKMEKMKVKPTDLVKVVYKK